MNVDLWPPHAFAHMCICTHTNVSYTYTKEGRVSRYLGGIFKAFKLSPHSQGARPFTVSHAAFLQDSQLPNFSTPGSLQASIAWCWLACMEPRLCSWSGVLPFQGVCQPSPIYTLGMVPAFLSLLYFLHSRGNSSPVPPFPTC